MRACPVCGEPDGQFVRSVIELESTDKCSQGDVYRCTRCDYEWRVAHNAGERLHPLSEVEFELTAAM